MMRLSGGEVDGDCVAIEGVYDDRVGGCRTRGSYEMRRVYARVHHAVSKEGETPAP